MNLDKIQSDVAAWLNTNHYGSVAEALLDDTLAAGKLAELNACYTDNTANIYKA